MSSESDAEILAEVHGEPKSVNDLSDAEVDAEIERAVKRGYLEMLRAKKAEGKSLTASEVKAGLEIIKQAAREPDEGGETPIHERYGFSRDLPRVDEQGDLAAPTWEDGG